MSDKRTVAMGQIQASIDGYATQVLQPAELDEDSQLDQAAAVQSNKELLAAERVQQAQLKTPVDIQRLEAAKRKATSQAVRDEMTEEQQRIQAAQLEKEQAEQVGLDAGDVVRNVSDTAWKTIDRVRDVSRETWDGLARVTTPGSIFLPVAVLLIFFFLLLPVNGHTRAEWLWFALTGSAQITGSGTQPTVGIQGNPAVTTTLAQPGQNFTGVVV